MTSTVADDLLWVHQTWATSSIWVRVLMMIDYVFSLRQVPRIWERVVYAPRCALRRLTRLELAFFVWLTSTTQPLFDPHDPRDVRPGQCSS